MPKHARDYESAKIRTRILKYSLPSDYLQPRVAAYIRDRCKQRGVYINQFFREVRRVRPRYMKDGTIKTHGYYKQMLYNMESGFNWDGVTLAFIIRCTEYFGETFWDFCAFYIESFQD